jgi:tRNA pseudouridine38-40 synthase
VEQTLAVALGTALRMPVAPGLTVAGRTDAGVHARHQVAHTDVPLDSWRTLGTALRARLRGLLPGDIRVTDVAPAPPGFDARFSASWRRYSYRLCDAATGVDPLDRKDVVATKRPLDVSAMHQAASGLLGEHDFRAFCRPRPEASTIRTLQRLAWRRDEEQVLGVVQADAFCHHMVRALVGALVSVGEGRRPVTWPAEVLRAAVRDPAVTVMPAHGLVLEEVGYPPDDELGARARQSRTIRVLRDSQQKPG